MSFPMRMRNYGLLSVGLLIATLVFLTSCSTKPVGELPDPDRPVVKIVNIPSPGSHFTSSPVINWFGTDADGYIVGYEYAVVAASIVAAAIDTSDAAQVQKYADDNVEIAGPSATCTPACWTYIDVARSESPTRQEIRLLAGTDPADTVVQFFFVRAVDNDSNRSIVDFTVYSRSNNPPNTEITTIPEPGGYFDLPQLTETYLGIPLEWKGTDKIDFPNDADQPEFEFFYQVFGPFDESELELDSTGQLADGFLIDTSSTNNPRFILASRDTSRGGVWVTETSARFYDLWRNSTIGNVTSENYFVLKVAARDDAFAADPTPAFTVFRAIYPRFENRMLIYAPVNCFPTLNPGNIACEERTDSIDIYTMPEILDYYERIFDAAGFTDATITHTRPSKIDMAKHELLVMLGDGNRATFIADDYLALTEYLNFGGKVWVWASNPIPGYTAAGSGTLLAFNANSLYYRYFRVTAQWFDGWNKSYVDQALCSGTPTTCPKSNEQFVGGLALNGTGLRDFSVDLEKVQNTYTIRRGSESVNDHDFVVFRGAPNTNYFIRDTFADPLFLYNSTFKGSIPDNLRDYVRPLHGTVVAVRHRNALFSTAMFGFSPWAMVEADAVDLITRMTNWFYQ